MSTNTRDGILDEVIAWSYPLPLQPDEFTVRDYIARIERDTGVALSQGSARNRLDVLVSKGKLSKRDVILGGTHCNAYKVVSTGNGVDITKAGG